MDIQQCANNPNLYLFFIAPDMILRLSKQSSLKNTRQQLLELPKNKYILYQIEQFNQPNIPRLDPKLIENSYAIFDYSTINLKYYPDHLRENVKLFTPLIKEPTQELNNNKTIDILFIGNLNQRREKILNNIRQHSISNNLNYNIQVISDKTGIELINIIKQSKLILNLHYYPNAILELFRIHDVLPYDCKILSENPGNEEEMDLVEKYGNDVNFFPVIDDKLSNIEDMYKLISDKLHTEIDLDERKKFIEEVNDGNKNYLEFNFLYRNLFHKYVLKLVNPNDKINYEIIHNNTTNEFKEKKYYAHLHCFDISRFNEIYGEYIDKISQYFSIVITYSIGDNTIDIINKNFVVLKIQNKGMDIGAKFCAVAYLNDNEIPYEYILFLHSKSNPETRRKYFEPLLNILDQEFIENITNYDGYFPDIQWEIVGDRLKMISGNPHLANKNLPERNLMYRNELLRYLGCDNNTNKFIEGNCYILSKNVIDKLYTDPYIYNILNTESSFDYAWVRGFGHNLNGDINQVYKQFIERKFAPRNERSFDGYIEHVFERVILNLCDNFKCLKTFKICIIYVYYERKNEQKNQTNLSFFIKYGLDKSRWRAMDITTLFIINGKQCEVLIPEREDIIVLKLDKCNNLECWNKGIKYFEDKNKEPIYKIFSHLCYINTSCFGPLYEPDTNKHWITDIILDNKYSTKNKCFLNYDNRDLLNNNSKIFGSLNEDFLKLKLNYKDTLINISDYKHYFNKKNNKLLIYAHYDKDNIIKNYVIESLIYFSKLGYDIVFYTTSTSINNYDESFLPFKINYVSPFLKSGGDDWFMWFECCKKLKNQNREYNWIMLLNDSMLLGINGFDNMKNSIENMENSNIDFWGHWDSNEINYHIMSSIYEFKYEILDYFINFCNKNLLSCKSKEQVVTKCETQFTLYLKKMDFKIKAVINKDSYNFQPPKIFRYNTNNIVSCPSHNPLNISSWINNSKTFAIKYKYILPYLKESNLNNEFKERLRHIHIGKYQGFEWHFPKINIDLFRDNNIFGNEKKFLSLSNLEQKYIILNDNVQFV